MDNVTIESLTDLGFSSTEAKVYCTMVSEEKMNGYQIAKVLGISRSSVYGALENLLEKGAIVSIPGATSEYAVVEPSELIDKIVAKYKKSADSAKNMLETLAVKKRSTTYFANIKGRNNLLDAVRAMINSAGREILLNTSMDLKPFARELAEAKKRGVRVIIFSWLNLNLYGIDAEFYCNDISATHSCEQRFSMVVDNLSCIIGSNDGSEFIPYTDIFSDVEKIKMSQEDEDFLGMKSENRLMVNIIQEYIHFDIYLNKLRIKYGGEIITPDIHIKSLMETGN